ncbi:membrane protein containing Peptidase C14, caspase catalytic domain protein [Candidatus Magnetomorum sp. HK-1]|nr:membrane protein containing Peptidase C14, caspase catalytic domain protein [Candidatus Magnetomorum sp. HK-1]
MKKIIIYFICFIIIIESCMGCTILWYRSTENFITPTENHKSNNLEIVIDNYHIKNLRDGKKLTKYILSSLSNSFEKVSVCTSCDYKKNVIYVVPKPITIHKPKQKFKYTSSIIDIIYNSEIEPLHCVGKFSETFALKTFNSDIGPLFLPIAFPTFFLQSLFDLLYVTLSEKNLNKSKGDEFFKYCVDIRYQINASLKDLSINLHNKLLASSRLQSFANSIKLQQTKPALIEINPEYSDQKSIIPNKTIDAGEDSQINITLTNKGEGTAYDVVLKSNTNDNKVNLQNNIKIGDIHTGESKNTIIPLKADLTLQSGKAAIEIQAKEKRGYDSKKIKLTISKAALEKPNLSIISYKINDSNTGLAKGNGNSIPENGETIELIPLINNTGAGKAVNIDLKITSINNELSIQKETTTIPQILPSKKITGNLVFSIPRNFNDNKINIDIQATDVRGVSTAKKAIEIRTETYQPIIAYQYKLIDDNHNGFLENGEEGEIEIQPVNNGKMDAKNLRIILSADDLLFSNSQATIKTISAESSYVPLRFPFTVPRTLEKTSVNVQIQISQQDFPGLTDNINLAITPVVPDFELITQIIDPNKNNVIEQGESIELIVTVLNKGKLDAENVVLKLQGEKQSELIPGVILGSDNSFEIGRIGAGKSCSPKRFLMHIQRAANPGTLPLNFNISQKDFSSKKMLKNFPIKEELPENIFVKSKQPIEVPALSAPIKNSPPIMVIALPKNNQRTISEFIDLVGTVVDDKGIANIDFFVNGKRLDVARAIGVTQPASQREKRDFNQRIPLQSGTNEITVTAFDIENESISKTISVYRDSEQGELWGVVIGINRYASTKIPPLKYARNDAESFASYLKNTMGMDSNHLIELYDEKATLKNIKSNLGTFLHKKANKKEDTVYIFYAGHGAPERDDSNKYKDGIAKYILPFDAELNDLFSTALDMDTIAVIFKRIRAQRVFFIADSCYSGTSGGRSIVAFNDTGNRANISSQFLQRIINSGKGRVVLASSEAGEVSQESDKLKHGFFTYYLLEGLTGKADVDQDQMVDVNEAYRYVSNKVPDATNSGQNPVLKSMQEGQVIIGQVSKSSFSKQPLNHSVVQPNKRLIDSYVSNQPISNFPCSSWKDQKAVQLEKNRLKSTVKKWANAWSSMNIDSYLSFYSNQFKPDNGLSFNRWKSQRKRRLNKPYIRVKPSNFQLDFYSCTAAKVIFDQYYETKGYSDNTRKQLLFEKDSGNWKIIEEKNQ